MSPTSLPISTNSKVDSYSSEEVISVKLSILSVLRILSSLDGNGLMLQLCISTLGLDKVFNGRDRMGNV